jgi:hypothetical protein
MGTLSGLATACVLRRQRDVFGDTRFERLGSISVGHLYNLRNGTGYRAQRVVLTKTRGDKAVAIGLRKAPAPEGRPGYIRIDSVHQGVWDGVKGRLASRRRSQAAPGSNLIWKPGGRTLSRLML